MTLLLAFALREPDLTVNQLRPKISETLINIKSVICSAARVYYRAMIDAHHFCDVMERVLPETHQPANCLPRLHDMLLAPLL